MGIASGLLVYLLLWWWVFFMMLPIGVRRVEQVEAGHDAGAPERPHLWKKAMAATVLSGVLWVIVYLVIDSELISFREMAREMV